MIPYRAVWEASCILKFLKIILLCVLTNVKSLNLTSSNEFLWIFGTLKNSLDGHVYIYIGY